MSPAKSFTLKKTSKNKTIQSRAAGDSSDSTPPKSVKPSKTFICRIRFLDDGQCPLECKITKTDLGQKIFTEVCNTIGNLAEKDYFGLRFTDKHGERQWLDLDRIAYKQLKGSKTMTLNFRLKHYPSDPLKGVKQEITKYLIYLQIKRDLAQGRLLCPPALLGTVGAFVVQAELGDAPPAEELNLSSTCRTPDISMTMPDLTATPCLAKDSIILPNEASMISESSTNQAEYLRNFKIFITQTPEVLLEVMKKHQLLRGMSSKEAEEKLMNQVSQLPTFGIDPFPVIPHHKVIIPQATPTPSAESARQDKAGTLPASSETAAPMTEPVQLLANKPFYLGITWTGIVTFIGIQRSNEYHWDDIQRLGCDDKLFLVYLKETESKARRRLFRNRSYLLTFECESKAAALALWRWTVDRKCFFTLSEGKQAKRLRPYSSLFHRHTFRFSGRSHKELDTVAVDDASDHFTRVSTIRQGLGSASVGHAITSPNRLRPALLPREEFRASEVVEPPTEPVKSVDVDQLAAVLEQPVEEEAVAVQIVARDVDGPPNLDEQLTKDADSSVGEEDKEEIIEATELPQQLAAITNLETKQETEVDSHYKAATDVRKRVDHESIQRVAYEHVVSTLDQTIAAHSRENILNSQTPKPLDNHAIANGISKRIVKPSCSESHTPCSSAVFENVKSVNGDHLSYAPRSVEKLSTVQDAAWKASVAVATFMVVLGLVVVLETTPTTSDYPVIRYIRTNYVISGIDNYIYSPIRNAITGALSMLGL